MKRSAIIFFAVATALFLGSCSDAQIISELEQHSLQTKEVGAPISISDDDNTSEESPDGTETWRPDGMTGNATDGRDIGKDKKLDTRKVGEPISIPPNDDRDQDIGSDRDIDRMES